MSIRSFTRNARLFINERLTKFRLQIQYYKTPLPQPKIKHDSVITEQPPQPDMHPIFVFQMGRVGSISTLSSIKQAYESLSLPITIYHTHWQNRFEELEETARKDHTDPTLLIKDLQAAREIRKKLVDESMEQCNLVALVREPVARNVSTFFYALPEFVPNWKDLFENNTLTAEYLHRLFVMPKAFHSTPARWFDEQLKPVFDIDVYSSRFPKETGYKIYSSDKARLLVIRLESLAGCAKQAFHDFLQLPNFELTHTNSGEDRDTGELYRLFRSMPVSIQYLTQMYDTKYARHFYSDAELDTFMKRWTLK